MEQTENGKDLNNNENVNGKTKKDPLEWEEISCEHILQDEWMDVRRSAYRFPDGSIFEPYYSYSRRDYVVIVASDTEGKYICVRQYRQGIKKVTTEFPAGGIEKKDGAKETGGFYHGTEEDALIAAKRELIEETGYESDDWTHLLTVPSNATLADNYAYMFVAKNCRKVTGQSLDETEFLNIIRLSADEIEKRIQDGGFQQVDHIAAWLLSKSR
ncbi:MAG: NUDIX hydrolase [Lachnospiraceae bacterium]|nr:NUDIX hydrolase [Lachnospiraceae bacterium]